MVCPLCEHSQDSGDACEGCGRELVAAWDAPIRIDTLAGLEPRQTVAPAENIQPLPLLEITGRAPAPDVPISSLTDLEQTKFPSSGTVIAQAVQGLDRGRETLEPSPFDPDGLLTCRACGNQQAGSLCDRCGMRLPRYRPPEHQSDAILVVCHNCNVRSPAGERCDGCGMRLPLPLP